MNFKVWTFFKLNFFKNDRFFSFLKKDRQFYKNFLFSSFFTNFGMFSYYDV